MNESACMPIKLSRPQWVTRYRVHHRGVDRYRVGRVFVAGDAAHVHSPAGGQGMNTGLQDAANLAWKLAAVINHGADDALLDTYHAERFPVGQRVLKQTDRLCSLAAGQTGWHAKLRDLLAPFIIKRGSSLEFVQRLAFRQLSEIAIGYEPDSLFGEPTDATSPRAGERAPDAAVSRATHVFNLIRGYRTHVLALSRKVLDEDELEAALDALARIRSAPNAAVAHLIARTAAGRDRRVVAVESADVFGRYGVHGRSGQALIVVRPDGYVAWRCSGFDFDACAARLQRLGLAREAEPALS